MKISLNKEEMIDVLKKYFLNTYNLKGDLNVTSDEVTLTVGKSTDLATLTKKEETVKEPEPKRVTITEMLGVGN